MDQRTDLPAHEIGEEHKQSQRHGGGATAGEVDGEDQGEHGDETGQHAPGRGGCNPDSGDEKAKSGDAKDLGEEGRGGFTLTFDDRGPRTGSWIEFAIDGIVHDGCSIVLLLQYRTRKLEEGCGGPHCEEQSELPSDAGTSCCSRKTRHLVGIARLAFFMT
jgi:hypothetical protein